MTVRGLGLGMAPALGILAAIGLLLVALGNDAARTEDGGAEAMFWAGLVAIYAPIAWRLVSPSPGRRCHRAARSWCAPSTRPSG